MYNYYPRGAKTHKGGEHQTPLELHSYPKDKRICVIEYLHEYIKHTAVLRKEQSQLLISFTKPHKAVTKDTIARWVKTTMERSGIDTKKFTGHNTRAASTSCVKAAGLNLQQVMKSAGWFNSSTFAKFYQKPVVTNNFCLTILDTTDNEV